MLAFFVMEKLARLRSGHSHSHGHSHGRVSDDDNDEGDSAASSARRGRSSVRKRRTQLISSPPSSRVGQSKSKSHSGDSDDEDGISHDLKVAGVLNLIADATHNFTDGMAIAASFLVSSHVGMGTTVAVLFHEIPHEIGDYAILIQSGFSKNKAMLMQAVTAVGALIGCVVGLFSATWGEAAESWILPFTAGGFIYIATVDVLPNLLRDSNVVQSIAEMLAMCVGVAFMVVIALYE